MAKKKQNKKKLTIILIGLTIILISVIMFLIPINGQTLYHKLTNKVGEFDTEILSKKKKKDTKINIVDVNSKTRPYAVMINNISTARPYHSGLQDAYIWYEIVVEGGITRYLTLFKDKYPERVGSVRSARHYYLDYALENDAYFIHHGWSPKSITDISSLKINNVNADPKAFFRDRIKGISSEHTSFVNMEKLKGAVEKYRGESDDWQLLQYEKDVKIKNYDDTKKANEVNVKFSTGTTSNFKYNEDKKNYYMSVNKKEHIDYVSKEQYSFKNIIVYNIKNFPLVGNQGGSGRQDIENIGKGEGYYISDGYAIKINWVKDTRKGKTKYYLENGKELKINDGNTYIGLQPTGNKIEIIGDIDE